MKQQRLNTDNDLQVTNFTRIKQQPNSEERANLLYRLYQLKRGQKYLAGIFRKHQQQIHSAFRGEQPSLMNKIKLHIEKLEQKSVEKN